MGMSVEGIPQDITERKRIEEKLRQQAQIMDQIHDSVVTTDLNGVITIWNRGQGGLESPTMTQRNFPRRLFRACVSVSVLSLIMLLSGARTTAGTQEDAKSSLVRWVTEQQTAFVIQENEKQALEYMRSNLDSGQRSVRNRFPERGFACSVDELRTALWSARLGGNRSEQAKLSSFAFDTAQMKATGYKFTLSCPEKSTPQHTYRLVAVPVVPGKTGKRIFCSEETHFVLFSGDGKVQTCIERGEPFSQGRDANDASQSSEDSAFFSLEAIQRAEAGYWLEYPEDGFTCSLADLRMPRAGEKVSAKAAGQLTAELASGTKNGYHFSIICPEKQQPQRSYRAVAMPLSGPKPGQRVLCVGEELASKGPMNLTGLMKFSSDGTAENCFATGTPLPQDESNKIRERTRALLQPRPGDVDDRRWKELNSSGERAYDQAKFEEAEKQLLAAAREAIAFGPSSRQLAVTLTDLGILYSGQKDYPDAELFLWRAFLLIMTPAEDPDFSHAAHALIDVWKSEGKNAEAEDLRRNIPIFFEIRGRVVDGRYTSPQGSFQVSLPQLAKPGAVASDRQVNATTFEVSFRDGFGRIYLILAHDNRDGKLSYERVAAEPSAQGALSEKDFVTTSRGRELRFVRFSKGGSFMAQRRSVPGQPVSAWPTEKLDLVTAYAVFPSGTLFFEIIAGVTPMVQLNQEAATKQAKENLEAFLRGFTAVADSPSH